MRLRCVVAATCLVATAVTTARPAVADGLDLDVLGARSIGRAGATTVSEDGAEALFINPAGLVRRTQLRMQLGMAFHDDDPTYRSPNATAMGSPDLENRAPALATPTLGVQRQLGPFVVGVSYLERGALQRLFTEPDGDAPDSEVIRLHPHRYAGTALRYDRRSFNVGAAIRASSWLGLGISASVDQIELSESRFVWAGFAGRDALAAPFRDMKLELLGAVDNFVPGVNAGILVAPPQLPLEMALSASYSADSRLSGRAGLLERQVSDFPKAELASPRASTTLSTPLRLRAGLRYLGERLFVEANGEVGRFIGDHGSPEWSVEGVSVRDETGVVAELATLPSLIDRRSYAGARISTDVELISGFLWLTAGYAYRTGSSRQASATVAFADLGGHTAAIGAEGQWNGMTLTVGYARFIQPGRTVTNSVVALPNPFDAGTTAIGDGRYTRTRDAFGAQLEVSWE